MLSKLLCIQEAATSWDLRSVLTYPFLVAMLGVGLVIYIVPVIQILRRTGHSAVWCVFAFIPVLNVIALWIFAFKKWPKT